MVSIQPSTPTQEPSPPPSTKRVRVLPKTVGRFSIDEELGVGSQGIVLLGTDPELHRQVAIKLLRPTALAVDAESLADEARIVSRFQHPNIVTLYEIGHHHGLPYFVSEYVAGESLRDRLDNAGPLPVASAVILMSRIAGGIAYAHERGIGHYDLNPANVLVAGEHTPKVMDFGLSGQAAPSDGAIRGTLRYMSPQRLEGAPAALGCDVFALGAMFFELLTGRPRFDPAEPNEIMMQIFRTSPDEIEDLLPEVPSVVLNVIRTALAGRADERYPQARQLKDELDKYRIPRAGDGSQGMSAEDHPSVQFLFRKMKYKPAFSALTQNLNEIRRARASDSSVSAKRLGNIIAKDVALIQRVLATANSALYTGVQVTTISRAVVMLGLDQVRLCMTSALVDSHFSGGSIQLQDALIRFFHSGLLASEVANLSRQCPREDAFIGGMFHDLGRTLVIHYFEDEYVAIHELVAREGIDELTASRNILGVPYFVIGAEVAKAWRLPAAILGAMTPLPRGELSVTDDQDRALAYHAAFANQVAQLLSAFPPAEAAKHLDALCERMRPAFKISLSALDARIEKLIATAQNYAQLMKVTTAESPYLQSLADWAEWRQDQEEQGGGRGVEP